MIEMSLDMKLKLLQQKALEINAERDVLLRKGYTSVDPTEIVAANSEMERIYKETYGDQKSFIFDMLGVNEGIGWRNKQLPMSFDLLRSMSRVPLIRSVIGTRLSQINNFSSVANDDNSVGWRIRRRADMFPEDDPEITDVDKRSIESLTKFLLDLGLDADGNALRDSFDDFLQMVCKDSLEMDQSTFEIVNTRAGKPHHFIATDGGTYRLSRLLRSMNDVDKTKVKKGQMPTYVQIYEDRIINEFYSWELCFGVRNRNTNIRNNGYGVAELEDLVRTVTWILNSDDYNGKAFSQGSIPKGILTISGNVGQREFIDFKNSWVSMATGVHNSWRTPVLRGDNVGWLNLQNTNKEMEYKGWLEYLVRVVCAVFKMDITEMGFQFSGGGSGGGGFEGRQSHKQKTDYSKDKGLYPLLKFIEQKINRYLIWKLNPKYEFVFTGISPENESDSIDLDSKRVQYWVTVNEIREKRGMPPLPSPAGDLILNSIYMQSLSQQMMGGQDSNAFVDGEQGQQDQTYEQNPFDQAADQQGGNQPQNLNKGMEDDSPFIKEMKDWISKGMPKTIDFTDEQLVNIGFKIQ